MRMLTKWMFLTVLSVGAEGAAETAATLAAVSGAEASVAYRSEATKRFEAPSAATLKGMAARTGGEAPNAVEIDELAALDLREEAVAVPAGGVKLRLRGGLRSALLAEERDGKVVLSCEGAPAEAQIPSPASAGGGEVRP